MVRLGPSASNRQPWRIIHDQDQWHFYLRRSAGYGQGISGLFMATDLQRVDMGIAMSHFALTAQELGLGGAWRVEEPGIKMPNELTEYVVSWVEGGR
jgi:nitroreductase